MSNARTAFNILGLGGTAALATFIALQPRAETVDSSLRSKFTEQVSPPPETNPFTLVIVGPDGKEQSYTDPKEIRRALDALPTRLKPQTELQRLEQELKKLTENDPIPYELMVRLAGSESGFDTDAVSNTGARGILQFMPLTQLEQLYLNKDKLPSPYAELARNIERRVTKNGVSYHIKKGVDHEKIYALADEPTVAFILGREYVRSIAETLRAKLPGRKLTYTDIKAGYVFGPTGAVPFLKAAADPKKQGHRALDYVDRDTVAGNPGLFYARPKAHRIPRSIKWLYNHFREKMGTDLVPENLEPAPLPPQRQGTASTAHYYAPPRREK